MTENFNIDRFMDSSSKLDLSDIAWDEVPKHPLTPQAVRTLHYFLKTEGSTFFYLKAVIQTKAACEEPDFAPFLCAWTYEEEFHGRAFRKFMQALGEHVPDDYRTDMFLSRGPGERFDEYGQMLLSRFFPKSWPAVHMVWGAIAELTTYMAYQAVIERMNHPILNEICKRIMKQELRHYAFYKEQAKRFLQDPAAQRFTSFALKLAWTPVGDGMCPKDETYHAIRFLFDGMDGKVVEKIEQKTRELPGLGWFDLFTRFVKQHNLRRAPLSWMPHAQQRRDLDITEAAVNAA
jgi:rubrerythrin